MADKSIMLDGPDEEDVIFHRPVMLWEDALIDGEARLVGGPNVFVPEDAIKAGKHYPAKGGDLARLLDDRAKRAPATNSR